MRGGQNREVFFINNPKRGNFYVFMLLTPYLFNLSSFFRFFYPHLHLFRGHTRPPPLSLFGIIYTPGVQRAGGWKIRLYCISSNIWSKINGLLNTRVHYQNIKYKKKKPLNKSTSSSQIIIMSLKINNFVV